MPSSPWQPDLGRVGSITYQADPLCCDRRSPDLAHLAGCLRSGAPLAEHERALAATVLEDAALRCRPALAARLRQEALRTRNGLVYELGRLYFPDGSLRARASALIAAAKLYRSASWRHHRALAAPPDSIVGTDRELLWRSFKACERFPLGTRTIENLIR